MYYESQEITNWKDNKVFEILENSIVKQVFILKNSIEN